MSRLPWLTKNVSQYKLNYCFFRSYSTGTKLDNHYNVLDIERDSSQADIKDAYYKLSKQYHPDRNPGDENASDKFRKITEAYDVLSNLGAKQEYDRALSQQDINRSPYKPKYKPPPFREMDPNSGKPKDPQDYTQFYRNRRAQLGRPEETNFGAKINTNGSFSPNEAENPFQVEIDPSEPTSATKKYKYYSESNWTNEQEEIQKKPDVSSTNILLLLAIIGSMSAFVFSSDERSYYTPPKS